MQHEVAHPAHEIKNVVQTTCCIVGGGPAGVILALLLARKGIPVMLLEAHMDFEREFRGDTIHPSTMEVMDQLGLADRLLQIRHTELRQFAIQVNNSTVPIVGLSRLKTRYPYITVMAQARFLDFLTEEAKRYPAFQLVMGAQVDELLEEGGVIRGVRYRGHDGWYEVRAALTIGADGRFSRLRKLAGLESVKTSPPMDILWFRLSRKEGDKLEGLMGRFKDGVILVCIDRFDYWQLGYVIPKGGYQQIRAMGLEHLRQNLVKGVPEFADRVEELQDWKQVSVLSVESDRLSRWYRPGLLLIGDAAHVMSPVGGVGINYAIQDAVAVYNLLGERLQSGRVDESDLRKVQMRRELATRAIQTMQTFLQGVVLKRALRSSNALTLPPFVRLLLRLPFIGTLPARMIAFGLRPERLKE
jgi:2-polyprenyl-6-methoxyphenol hydroxylase-like FAD-dependent oxidoreductase